MARARARGVDARRARDGDDGGARGRTCVVQRDTRAVDGDDANDGTLVLTARVRELCARDASCAYVGDGDGSSNASGTRGGDGGATASDAYPPYWAKVFAAKRALEDAALKCARVIWVDSDATFHDSRSVCAGARCETTVRSVSEIAEELFDGKDFFYSRDPSMTPPDEYWGSEFNAGFWGCANTTRGREIMTAWTKTYPVKAWSRGQDGHWTSTGNFAGWTYEQGAFVHSGLLKKYKAVGAMKEVDACAINTPCESLKEASIRGAQACHFAGVYKETYLPGYYADAKEDHSPFGTHESSYEDLSTTLSAVSEPFMSKCKYDLSSTGTARTGTSVSAERQDAVDAARGAHNTDVTIIAVAVASVVTLIGYVAARRRRRRTASAEDETAPLV
ncbi:hypothetical protein BE221DRAFT_192349 [Ostreococcus tauri]|uniref:Nucleotide-diphospho-sugar transferase n=1 Tax=Ostreococcus tauri TaxID=70448 RepID=A0A1Y5I9V8_OSTTA|nr:hypothetical protein BE221DRAFT_192349 [Ostreococcus tauri]